MSVDTPSELGLQPLHPHSLRVVQHLHTDGVNVELQLNRPDRLNAFDSSTVRKMCRLVEGWGEDTGISGILLTSSQPRAFCSGGDLKAMWEEGLEVAWMSAFFEQAYRNLLALSQLSQPIASFPCGVTMGGGAGLNALARYRIAHENLRWAMPENNLGLFPDVAITRTLVNCRHPILGEILALTGQTISASDAAYCGLVDVVLDEDAWHACRHSLSYAPPNEWASLVEAVPVNVSTPGPLQANQMLLEALYAETPDPYAFAQALEGEADNPFCCTLAERLKQACPHRLAVTSALLQYARQFSLAEALSVEHTLVVRLLEHDDNLREGIKARLLARDYEPRWQPEAWSEVDQSAVLAQVASAAQDPVVVLK